MEEMARSVMGQFFQTMERLCIECGIEGFVKSKNGAADLKHITVSQDGFMPHLYMCETDEDAAEMCRVASQAVFDKFQIRLKFEPKPFKKALTKQQQEDKGWVVSDKLDNDSDRHLDKRATADVFAEINFSVVEKLIHAGLLDSCAEDDNDFLNFAKALKKSLPKEGLSLWLMLCLRSETRQAQHVGLVERWSTVIVSPKLNIESIKKWAKANDPDFATSIINEVKKAILTEAKDTEKQNGDDSNEGFDKVAKQFEKTHAKIVRESVFVSIYPEKIEFKTKEQLKTSYSHLMFIDSTNQSRPFISKWLFGNPKQKRYDTVGTYPPGGSPCPTNVLNLWTPYAMERVTTFVYKQEAVDLYLNHIKIMCNHNEEMTQYFNSWHAQIIQVPGIKTRSPALTSKMGAGKTGIQLFLEKMLGEDKVLISNDPVNEVFTKFNNLLAGAILVCLDEMDAKDMAPHLSKLRGWQTGKSMSIEVKSNSRVKIPSYHRWMMAWNEGRGEPVQTTEDERRTFIVRASDELIGNTEYHKKFYDTLEDIDSVKSIYEHYKCPINYPDMKDFHRVKPPVSHYQRESVQLHRSPVDMWLEQFTYDLSMMKDRNNFVELSLPDILTKHMDWAKDNGYTGEHIKYNITTAKLNSALSRLDCGVSTGSRVAGFNYKKFDISKLMIHYKMVTLFSDDTAPVSRKRKADTDIDQEEDQEDDDI